MSMFSIGPALNYTPDLFGQNRRLVEQDTALAENQSYQLAAAYLTLTSDAVTQAITIASILAQIKAVNDIFAVDNHNLDLVRIAFTAGSVARTDVLSAESQLANDRTLLPPLQQQLSVAQHALSVLVGKAPAEWSPPDFELDTLTLPGELPVTVPSELVRGRPDILAAEAQLHAASAAIGVATAQLSRWHTGGTAAGSRRCVRGRSRYLSGNGTPSLRPGRRCPTRTPTRCRVARRREHRRNRVKGLARSFSGRVRGRTRKPGTGA